MYIPNKHIVFGVILVILIFVGVTKLANHCYTQALIYASLIIFTLIIWIVYHKLDRKCPHCERLGAMENIHEEIIERTPTTSGKFDRPATLYSFHIHRKCKYCGHEDIFEYHKTRVHSKLF